MNTACWSHVHSCGAVTSTNHDITWHQMPCSVLLLYDKLEITAEATWRAPVVLKPSSPGLLVQVKKESATDSCFIFIGLISVAQWLHCRMIRWHVYTTSVVSTEADRVESTVCRPFLVWHTDEPQCGRNSCLAFPSFVGWLGRWSHNPGQVGGVEPRPPVYSALFQCKVWSRVMLPTMSQTILNHVILFYGTIGTLSYCILSLLCSLCTKSMFCPVIVTQTPFVSGVSLVHHSPCWYMRSSYLSKPWHHLTPNAL